MSLSRTDYDAAVQYLAVALAPRVKVELASLGKPPVPAVRLTVPRRTSAVIRLREWTDTQLARRIRRPGETIWILPRATRELVEQLRATGQSYVDPSGAVRVELPWLLVDRTDLEPMALPEAAGDPFADRSSLIVRALLEHSTRRSWSIRELAKTAEVGLGTASRVVDLLHRLDLVDAAREHGKLGRVQVIDPQRLLDRWTRTYDWTRNESLAVHAPIGDPEAFVAGRQLYDAFRGQTRWALTLQAGAAFVVRYAAWERVHVYVDVPDSRQLGVLALTNRWTPSDDGRLVLMRPFYRTSIWPARDISRGIGSDLNIVSNLQLVLDLWNYPLRGREQGELIRDRILRPVWEAET